MIGKINSVKFIYKGELERDKTNEDKVQEYWRKIKQKKDFLHEARILNVSNFVAKGNDYIIELKETIFSEFMYAKEYGGDIRAMFSGEYILTADKFVGCVLNQYYENELEFETLNLVGGMADATDIVDGEYSCEKNMKRETKEELGFDLEDGNWNIQLKYLKYPSENESPVGYPIGTIYEIKTSYTKAQLEKMFEEATHDNEVKKLVFFSKEDYREIINYKHKKQYMPELFEKIFEK